MSDSTRIHPAAGAIRLAEVYRLLLREPQLQHLLKLSGKRPPGRKYTELCEDLVKDVPNQSGVYLSGRYDERRLWHNIYLGNSGRGKRAGLRSRILEELKDERAFAFLRILSREYLHEVRRKIHRGKYKSHWERAFNKAGTTHILWVTTGKLAARRLPQVESDLIELMSPTGNKQRKPPAPNLSGDETMRLLKQFREQIHEFRKDNALAPPSRK